MYLSGEVVIVLQQGLETLLPVLPVGSLELTKARFEEKNPLGFHNGMSHFRVCPL